MTDLAKIRNFSIIAHIDHGKSTLADRLIQFTGGLTAREMSAQVLDNMDIERERGITIKAQTVRLTYKAHDGETYELNLMDTPGHVDFAYEVSRSLAACEGALLVVDAAQGVEAQTLANVYQSIEPLKAMLVDSWYDPYLGVVILVRVIDGVIKKGQQVKFMAGGTEHLIDRVGCFTPKIEQLPELGPGEIGFITAQIKEVAQARVGDTITTVKGGAKEALPGFKEVQPVVFCGLFPVDAAEFEKLRESISRLRLNDASFSFEMESSAALGFGFRCGFLGLLHLEIIQERLSREYDLDLITTAPSVVYRLTMRDGTTKEMHNPSDMPDPVKIETMEEPWIKATIYTPDEYLGSILKLCQDRRGIQTGLTYVGGRAQVNYELPLNEVVFDFYDRLKSISRGYASFDYEQIGLREGDLVMMNILVNNEPVDALSMIVHRSQADPRGRQLCERLKDLIPRHLFKIPIQAAIGAKVIARETIAAMRKDVTAKCYGGDISRKKKLLDKQKEGKKRMREYGNVQIPQEAFIAALRMGEE